MLVAGAATTAAATLGLACYIFHPALKNIEGALLSETTLLVGDETRRGGEDTLSFVIPAYNEAERLPIMLDSTFDYLKSNRKQISDLFLSSIGSEGRKGASMKCEFVIVNDGSTDNTDEIIRTYSSCVPTGDTLKLVSMIRNSGKGGAVKCGMLNSCGSLALMLDADGATDISDGLPKVLSEMKVLLEHAPRDVSPVAAVFGSRAHLEEESVASRTLLRTILMKSFHFFVESLCSPRIKDTQCGFKLFTRSAVVKLFTNLHLRRWAFDTEIVVIAEKLHIGLAEVGIVWNEVEGSKLDVNKLTLALVSLGMLRDMICVRVCYFLGIWTLNK